MLCLSDGAAERWTIKELERIGAPVVLERTGSRLVREANVAVLGFLFFATVLAVAVCTIVATVTPRLDYIAALLASSVSASTPVPVAQRRRVRQVRPLPLRSELRLLRAAA